MADRIFPNKYQESGLDSELVFTGINWDAFGQRLAAMEEGEDKKGEDVPVELMRALEDKYGPLSEASTDEGHEIVNAKWASVEEDDKESDEDESEEDESEEEFDFEDESEEDES